MDEVSERKRRRELIKDDNHTFVVKYEIKQLAGQKECFIKEVCPSRLGYPNRQEYNIQFHNKTKQIINVANRQFGNVKFRAILVDEQSGIVFTDVVKLWTHLFRP